MTRIRETWAAWMMDVALPFIAMLIITLLDVSLAILVKAAMNGGLESIVYCVYHNALATLVLFPFFIFHIFKNVERLPLTLHILFRFFILGLLGLCLYEILAYQGIDYSSPTIASAIGNLAPGITFLLAIGLRNWKELGRIGIEFHCMSCLVHRMELNSSESDSNVAFVYPLELESDSMKELNSVN